MGEMEVYRSVYTVEFYGSKGWEVFSSWEGLNDAINDFRHNALVDSEVAWRLTTPTK